MVNANPPEVPDIMSAVPAHDAPQQLAAPTSLDRSESSSTMDLYRAAIGPVNTAYYEALFTRFEASDRAGPSWNWTAALLTFNWMAFRQLWGAALAYIGALVGASESDAWYFSFLLLCKLQWLACWPLFPYWYLAFDRRRRCLVRRSGNTRWRGPGRPGTETPHRVHQ